jgi:hypothetical protein
MRETRRRPGGVMARLRWLEPTAVILGSCLLTAGCGPSASGGGTVAPGGNGNVRDGSDPEGQEEGDDVGALRARLDRLSTQQHEKASGSDGSFGACEDLCSLASSICTVKEKLCDVADRHPGEEEYQGLCRKAELECSEAEDSCVACVEARESREGAKASSPGR